MSATAGLRAERAIRMAQRIGALKGDLAIVRATILANMEKFPEGWVRGQFTECIERIDRALAEKEI